MRPILSSLTLSFGTILTLHGCGGDSTFAVPDEDVRDYFTAVATSAGVLAAFHPGSPPAAGSGPAVTIGGTSAMITGGSSFRTVSSGTTFHRVLVAVEGADGWWELTLPVAVLAEELVLTLAQNISQPTFDVVYALGSSAGIGSWDSESVQLVVVGTGVVQVSVSWDSAADVDLYVVDPAGEEIYYNDRQSSSGGQLDLDSNAGCVGQDLKNENITWLEAAPSGTYTVRVNLWDACGATSTSYVVTVRRKDQPPVTFNGTLTGPGNNGGLGDGEVVTTFTY